MNRTITLRALQAAIVLAAVATVGGAIGQDGRTGGLHQELRPNPDLVARPAPDSCNCSNPVNVHIVKNAGPTSALANEIRPDFRLNQQAYNHTQPNTHFTDTLRWKMPASRTCELKGTLTIKVKNLGTSLSSNDSVGVFQNGAVVPGMQQGPGVLWTSGQGAGTLKTITFPLTGAIMAQGQVTVFAQDDTAVQEVRVDIRGCCITPTP